MMRPEEILFSHQREFHPVVPFDPGVDKLCSFDFTTNNKGLSESQFTDTETFSGYINEQLGKHQSRYGIGGYNEHRTIYARSRHFDTDQEPRRLHLGMDVWGPTGTKVMCPVDGIVHSFAFNNQDSDYGATIILTHQVDGLSFHTLYGHLSLNSIKNLHEGQRMTKGEVFTEFGMRFENGNWPSHLHFQIVIDMKNHEGDYPGVCKFSERQKWLENSPDPDLILQMKRYLP